MNKERNCGTHQAPDRRTTKQDDDEYQHYPVALNPLHAAANELWSQRVQHARPIERRDLYWIPALEVLRNVTSEPTGWLDRWRISPTAGRLARAALRER